MTRVKVCGLGSREDLRVAVDAGADAVGVVAAVPVDTPREVSVAAAADLLRTVPPFVSGVLVTMPDSVDHAVDLVERVGPDAVQLHGDLGPAAVASVAARTDVDVLKAVDAADPARAADFDDVADALLVDSASAEGGGGTGETHDWERTREATADLDSPLVLAGGLTPDNVAAAVAAVDPFAVDVASGVEERGGVKDHDAVRAFVAAATGGGPPATDGGDAGREATDEDEGAMRA